MATSKCVKCDNTSFEMVENSPSKSNFKVMFIQCSRCGTVVGTMEYFNTGNLIKELEKTVDNTFQTVNRKIEGLYNLIQSKK